MLEFDQEAVSAHLRYKIANAEIKQWPFPHFFMSEIFPPDFYASLLAQLPSEEEYRQGSATYNGRKFGPTNCLKELDFMLSEQFLQTIVHLFYPWFKKRFENGGFNPKMDLRLILDGENYAIGPHTDAKWKVVSLLFYLPRDFSLVDLGTSLYTPKDPKFRCEGGPHHKFEDFTEIWRAPFVPNSVLGFWKTNNSFHGVKKVTIPCRRDVLLWNLYDESSRK